MSNMNRELKLTWSKLSDTFSDLLDAFLDKANIFGEIPFVGTPFRIAIALTKRAFEVSLQCCRARYRLTFAGIRRCHH